MSSKAASLANQPYKYCHRVLSCTGTRSNLRVLSVVLQSFAAFGLGETLCFLGLELSALSFLTTN